MLDEMLTTDSETNNPEVQIDVQDTEEQGDLLTGQKTPSPESAKPLAGTRPERPAWMGQLPKELQTSERLTKFQTIGELGKSYQELEGRLGRSILVPDDKSSPEDQEAYLKKLGRPDKPEGYEIVKPKMPEGMDMDASVITSFQETAFKAGMTPKQLQSVVDMLADATRKQYESSVVEAKNKTDRTREGLAKEWGTRFDEQIGYVQKAFKAFASQDIQKTLTNAGLAADPNIVKMFAKIGKSISEDRFVEGERGGKNQDPAQVLYGKK